MSRWSPQPAPERVLNRSRRDDGGCLIFGGYCDKFGYGVVRDGDKNRKAHRVVYEAMVGPILEGLTVDHMCETPSCVDWTHMQLVSAEENVALRYKRHGAGQARRKRCDTCGVFYRVRARGGRFCSQPCFAAWMRAASTTTLASVT